MRVITNAQRTLSNAKRGSLQMIQHQPASRVIRKRKKKILLNVFLPILGGIIIGILTALILRFMGAKFF